MPISMYQASLPPLVHMLNNLKALLQKGVAHADARKFESTVLVSARLAPDMYPLSRQVQIACDVAKGCGARLAGVEPPKFEDKESTMDELLARVDKTLAFLGKLKAKQIDSSEGRTITLKFPSMTLNFTAQEYLQGFVMTNFYFHVSMVYAILRHNGVEIGKRDYLGGGGPRPQRRKVSKKKKR